ncbi:uncharacterized protein BO80DRAFT_495041 [Aspergillus ibericus CBS 121593]|uniref:HAUS augmin-like complex subunit 6 N-terminal domain-containing protein n=1 Tax=Aspergillus ibericus CBS 121593 TaxID=1448316 RepID=A0A395GUI6_9EURO|nr:hypothetical protein BO80DRAFT_495041 [Aspergillus ibericus CBS 121593]RAK99230.1 hypothetical protein BO80DRAFT_495041 [Aspergillus ibericus CBS 121593]
MQSRTPRLKPPSPNWAPQPPLSVFVRNLQLLQLDRHDDWPHISLRTLADTSQNQRQRVRAIEWALYHLVALWDPSTARDKLRPFFPPLEPLQSVNLRAALFRVLSDLKKQGDLGKEVILRKSMLDDCRGEKFEELLAVFSTAVLRKTLVASSDPGLQNVAMRLSLAPGLTREEYQLMLPLVLAHRVSLNQIGERRKKAQDTQERFAHLLELKKLQLDERAKENRPQLPDNGADVDALARDFKESWLGREDWADALLHGGAQGSNDAFLELSFDAAWTKAKESTVDGLRANTSPDLLVDLESRVFRQRARLQRWRQYSASMRKHDRVESTSSRSQPLVFREHQALTVASISKAVRQPVERASPKADDRALLFSMNEALARINGRSAARHRHTKSESRTRNTTAVPSSLSAERHPSSPTDEQDTPRPSTRTPSPPTPESQSSLPSFSTTQAPERPPSPSEPPSRFTLVERTRKSMSLIPPPTNTRPRESFRSHRPRPSYPVNQFETPQKPHPIPRASTPRDQLFDDEADYASVFKSRPRVALSPVASPAVHISPIGDFDLGADEDVDLDELGEGDEYAQDTPLASRRRVL